jgi:GNAT superfamily N-acetyltransferase
VIIRAATPDDLPAIAAVMAAAGEPVEWPGLPGWPYLEALLARPGGRVLVASESDGSIAGVGASVPLRDDLRFLTDLFVHPDRQSAGVGRALLDAALAGTSAHATFSSADPRALAAYVRAGLRPWWPFAVSRAARSRLHARRRTTRRGAGRCGGDRCTRSCLDPPGPDS